LAALFLLLCAAAPLPSTHAQFTDPGSGPPPWSRRSLYKLASTFSWADLANFTGPVDIPVGPGGGWLYLSGFAVRLVPSPSTDPTLQLTLYPPNSGHPTLAEDVLIQFPLGPAPAGGWPVLIGFHPYNVSHASVTLNTQFPQLCAQKGYVLISPYGMSQYNFANPTAQQALDKVIDLIDAWIPLDKQRVYTVGFSMGALNAVSWAMRHQDKNGYRVAGVIVHTGTQDVIDEYNTGTFEKKNQLISQFGGSPTQVPFAYARVNPIRMLAGSADPNQAHVTNLLHVPLYINVNLDDPQTKLVEQTTALKNYLVAQGAQVNFQGVHAGATHGWSTLDQPAALDWIDGFTLPPDPPKVELWADASGPWLQTEVRALPPNQVARYKIDRPSTGNLLSISNTQFLDTLAFAAAGFGASTASTLFLETQSLDGTADTLVLTDYAQAPSSVTLFGILPPEAWSYDALLQELTIVPTLNGAFTQVVITP
jgi:pimeloyl-ACP methyl ester carboxylesterase